MNTNLKNQSRYFQQATQLKNQVIKFIASEEFENLSENQLRDESPDAIFEESSGSESVNGHGMLGSPLLTTDGERWLFKKMNYLKFELDQACSKLVPQRATNKQIERIDALQSEIYSTRSMIVEANTRLVVSIANRFSNSLSEGDDLVSEGNMILINAVDKFDYSRGFRFSTYATHAIQRHYFRYLQRNQKKKKREIATSTELLSDVIPGTENDAPLDYKVANSIIERFHDCLDERETVIIRERFGLNEEETSETLKVVADRVGLSKERVRQLQMRAIEKLQDLAIKMKLRLDPSF